MAFAKKYPTAVKSNMCAGSTAFQPSDSTLSCKEKLQEGFTRNWRIFLLDEAVTSSAYFSFTLSILNAIFDCPEHNHTSPIRISSTIISFSPVMIIRYGPPACILGRIKDHLLSSAATVL